MATKTKTLPLVCPWCLDADATLSLDINDAEKITCSSCEEVFTSYQAFLKTTAVAERWKAIHEWVNLSPDELAPGRQRF